MSTQHHRWQPIEDYPVEPQTLQVAELHALARVWGEQRAELERRNTFKQFNDRLRREWCIETGLLERLYTIDRGVTRLLIERGLDAALIPHHSTNQDPTELITILHDHEEAYDFLTDRVGGQRPLSASFIKELHALLTRNQHTTTAIDSLGQRQEIALRRGEFKLNPNNPVRGDGSIHEYCPPVHVDSEMQRLLDLHAQHTRADVPPEVEAAWLHHRFAQIHPFQDGNGRIARSLATLILLRARWFPLVIRDANGQRARYLDALEAADQGDLRPLIGFFAERQQHAFVQALGVARDVTHHTRVEHQIDAIRQTLEARRADQRARWEQVKPLAERLRSRCFERLNALKDELEQLQDLLPDLHPSTDTAGDEDNRSDYFRRQIIQTARHHDYYANLKEFRAWARLVLRSPGRTELLIAFHGMGEEFRGVLAASACIFRKERTDEGTEITDVTPLGVDVFRLTYVESVEPLEHRFHDWLETILNEALAVWRRGL